jgi:hypothetical protein
MKKVEFTRIEMAILSILYEVYPMGMDQDKIFELIEERGLLTMSNEEFDKYTHEIKEAKQN